MVPHLITALNGPLLELESKVLEATPAIERWFRLEWQEHTPPFYCSVDDSSVNEISADSAVVTRWISSRVGKRCVNPLSWML